MQYTATGARLEEDRETLTMSFWSDLLARSNVCEVAPDFLLNQGIVTVIGEWRPSGAFVRDSCWISADEGEPVRVEMTNCWTRSNIFSYACKLAGAQVPKPRGDECAVVGHATLVYALGQITQADVALHAARGHDRRTDYSRFVSTELLVERQPFYSTHSGNAPPLRNYDVWNIIHRNGWTTHTEIRVQ